MNEFVVFLGILAPVVLGATLVGVGDAILKKIWKLPDGKWSKLAAPGWTFLTSFEMIIAFFLNLFVLMGEIPLYVFVINIIIYIFLSALILIRKNEKMKKIHSKFSISNHEIHDDFDDYEYDDYDDYDDDEVDIFDSIDFMDGHKFEYYCANLLEQNGFTDVRVTQGSGDQGVDVLATKGGVKYAIQCKNYATPLSNKPIQEVTAGKMFYNCHVGVVMTNSTFTPSAQALAQATGVLLWDRNVLEEMIEIADDEY